MCYNRNLLTTEQGLFLKAINGIQDYCRTYKLVSYSDLKKEGEIYTFEKKLPNGKVKGVQASRLMVSSQSGFYGYLVRFNFYKKEV